MTSGRRHRIVSVEENDEELRAHTERDTEIAGEEVVTESRADSWVLARRWMRTLAVWAWVALAVVEPLLGFRLVFRLAGANPRNGFVDFIYDLGGALTDPFDGIARNRSVGGGGVFEPGTLTAMAVYLVAALLLVLILKAARATPSPRQRSAVSRTERKTRIMGHR